MPAGRIVENSYYDHDEYGRVRVVDLTNGVVSMERVNEKVWMGTTQIPDGVKQSAAGFQRDAEPADVTVKADLAVFDSEALHQ